MRVFDTKSCIYKFISIHGDRYDYTLVDYLNSKSKVIIWCHTHGYFTQQPNSHISGKGCPGCDIDNRTLKVEDFIRVSNEIHNNKYDYSLSNYKNSRTKIDIICKEHGIFKQAPYHHKSNEGCPVCKSSKGEKKILSFLIENNIKFERQKTFDGCESKYKLRFDFYLVEYNICIEFDGEYHFKPIDNWGGIEKLKNVKLKDDIKNNFCIKNNINLIRITYLDDIIEKMRNLF